jgi:hypothetical protein
LAASVPQLLSIKVAMAMEKAITNNRKPINGMEIRN